MSSMISFAEALLMVSALSVDTFIASFAYGAGKIRISLPAALLISVLCSFALLASMLLGRLTGPLFPTLFAKTAAFCILIGLGLYYIMCPQTPPDADKDGSKSLSLRESTLFALAMSIDNAAVGVSAGLLHTSIPLSTLLSLLFTLIVVKGGAFLGRKTIGLSSKSPAWIGGLLLILLALTQLN